VEALICLKCNSAPIKMRSPDGSKGFCHECWRDIFRPGSCVICGSKDELTTLLSWHGIVLEEICYYCFNTMEYTDESDVHSKIRKEPSPGSFAL